MSHVSGVTKIRPTDCNQSSGLEPRQKIPMWRRAPSTGTIIPVPAQCNPGIRKNTCNYRKNNSNRNSILLPVRSRCLHLMVESLTRTWPPTQRFRITFPCRLHPVSPYRRHLFFHSPIPLWSHVLGYRSRSIPPMATLGAGIPVPLEVLQCQVQSRGELLATLAIDHPETKLLKVGFSSFFLWF